VRQCSGMSLDDRPFAVPPPYGWRDPPSNLAAPAPTRKPMKFATRATALGEQVEQLQLGVYGSARRWTTRLQQARLREDYDLRQCSGMSPGPGLPVVERERGVSTR
jgi:hypothetical protein